MKHPFKKVMITTALAFAIFLANPTVSHAADAYTVTPISATLYTGAGAELFTQPDFTTFTTSVKGDIPVQVTGATSNGFYEIRVSGATYYVPKKALANCTGTTAYKFAQFESKACLVGSNSGEIYYQKEMNTRVAPASTTKLMTALLTVEAIDAGQLTLETPVTVSQTALASLPSDASHMKPKLQAGEVITVGSLLEACLIESDCQACNILAETISGNVPNFVVLMNSRAKQLGCTGTNFVNPSGYPDPNHYTTAYDMYLIACQALKSKAITAVVSMDSCVIPATNLTSARALVNTNSLIIKNSAYYNPEVIGGKTGYAKSAGYCLVSTATRNGKQVISVVMGGKKAFMSDGSTCYGQYYDSNRLLAYGLTK